MIVIAKNCNVKFSLIKQDTVDLWSNSSCIDELDREVQGSKLVAAICFILLLTSHIFKNTLRHGTLALIRHSLVIDEKRRRRGRKDVQKRTRTGRKIVERTPGDTRRSRLARWKQVFEYTSSRVIVLRASRKASRNDMERTLLKNCHGITEFRTPKNVHQPNTMNSQK